ncbi:MAG: PBP1A family penicillin-binding protein [bacterium]|nr:PBP1A family penicillin-binding protein [bacterium]
MLPMHRPRPFTVLFLVATGLVFFVVGGFLLWIALTPTPDIASFATREVTQSTKIFDRTGQILLYDYNRDARRDVVPLSTISEHAINASIAIEDASFYDHGGIRLTSIVRAMLADVFGSGPTQGGSTITQQVVKNTLLTREKSVVRKAHEWALAIKMEQVYSKNQILETYLNDISYGGTLYGIEAASEAYFGISANDLGLAQAAYLAALVQAPSYYSPYGSHTKELAARKNLVLTRMQELGFITREEYDAAVVEKVAFTAQGGSSIIAPHFVFYILDYVREKYGESALISGLTVTTTLDADLQTHAESIIASFAESNLKNFKASNEAMIALDPTTGQILSMVGSKDFFSTEIDGQYNATIASRQPGSTFKPFVYALALMKGYTRNTVVFDVPTQFSTRCQPNDVFNNEPPCYAPQDFDGEYRGPMTFETALAQSINIPAVKVLYLVGVRNAVALAESFGITSLGDPDQYGLTLVLGGGNVRLLDMATAYGVFAADGVRNPPRGILEVNDGTGNTLEKFSPSSLQVIPANIARNMSAMLSDNLARVPEYPLNNPFNFPGYDVASKTGTTNDTRDAWVIGYTPSIVIGTWAGNNDNSPMVKSIAGFIVAPMWHEVMAYALTKYPKTYFGEPDPISSTVPPLLQGHWQIPDQNGQIVPHDLLYWTDKNNPLGPPPSNPQSDPQYPYWEYALQSWFSSHPWVLTSPETPPLVPISYVSDTPTALMP